VKRLHTLFTIQPNFLAMSNYLRQRNLRGICVYTTETIDRESIVHARVFAPHVGINEDPVTGTVQGQLSVCLFENGLLELKDGRCLYQAEQGDAMGRPGRVTVELNVDDQKPVSIRVGGSSVTVLEGEMIVHE
jgi:trans-2,3-dihydro-3-hydroxyanthranilate isomerase